MKLASVTGRSDRKAYANGNNGRSQLKDFFLSDLGLSVVDNNSDYFALYQVNDRDYFLYYIPNLLYNNFIKFFESSNTEVSVSRTRPEGFVGKDAELPLQQIFYGAPGTGKSHKVKEVTETLPKSDVFRTTFHPDSDYSTFVGCYKPKMVKAPIRDGSGHEITSACEDEKKRIAYEYEPQAFLKAYVRAYETNEPVFLVIEEINRGNCAQIFGDMFQLLDRNENGESDYAIKPETAIQEFLNENLKNCDIADETIKSGEEMRLPANLHIWATMNTSDQSLFPIDSAFKRRWDWKYVPIKRADKEPENKWIIKVTHGGNTYWCYWWEFLEAINHQIEETTHSEDKQLGCFFAKPKNGENFISTDTFVNKVIFYLWNDVFKDEDSAVFQYDNDKVEDVSISRSGAMYFRHFMENKDEMIHYFINQLFAMGEDNNPVVPIDYLKYDNDPKVIEHLPKMREYEGEDSMSEESSEDNADDADGKTE
ncbi:MAG: AAA family ATPase [Bacteroidia bacterium]|nr:AAA family ATPase [Bacteroidia bacterium]